MKRNELEDRLVDFAVEIIGIVEALPETKAGRHIAGQLVRAGTAPAPNYGEAQGAESRNDFIHKMKIALKELREALIWLKIVERRGMLPEATITPVMNECQELVAIFVASTKTADSNRAAK